MTDLAHDIFQNNIDYVAKQLQTFIDFIFPSNDDNSDSIMPYNPYIVTGQCSAVLSYYVYNGTAYYPETLYNVHFDANNGSNILNYMGLKPQYASNSSAQSIANSMGDKFHLIINPLYLSDRVIASNYTPVEPFSLDKNSYVQFLYTNENKQTAKVNGRVNFVVGNGNSFNYNTMRFSPVYLLSGDDYKPFIITSVSDATDQYNRLSKANDYYTSHTYTFNGGSSNGGGDVFVGGAAGGLAVGLVGSVGFADIEFALDSLIDELNLNMANDSNKLTDIDFPSYEEIKYRDMGDFFIRPLHQYDKIPTAPTFDGTIDLGDYPSVLAEGANTFLDFMPVTLSALFTTAFVVCVLLRKLGR